MFKNDLEKNSKKGSKKIIIKLQSKFGDYKNFLRTKETAKKIKALENNYFDSSEMYQEN